jgi:hypothetical protein
MAWRNRGYDLSILQAAFSLTQVLDRPLSGRIFFEEVIRENLDLGRPDQVQLIYEFWGSSDPGRFDIEAWARTAMHSETGPVTLRQLVLHAVRHQDHYMGFVVEKRRAFGIS